MTLLAAYFVSIVIGNFVVAIVLAGIRKTVPNQKTKVFEPLSFWLGGTERAIATTLVVWAPKSLTVFIGAWVALKLAANWQRQDAKSEAVRQGTLIALIGNALSFAIAIGVGLIINPDALKAWAQ